MFDALRNLLAGTSHLVENGLIQTANKISGAYTAPKQNSFKPMVYQPNDAHSQAVEQFTQMNHLNNANELARADQERGFRIGGMANYAPIAVQPRASLNDLLQGSRTRNSINPRQLAVQPQNDMMLQGYGSQDAPMETNLQGSWPNLQKASVRNILGR